MKITQITVSSSRKVPHPSVDFANLVSHASLTATLEDGDLAGLEAEKLQLLCHAIVETDIDGLVRRHTAKPRSVKPAEATANTASKLAKKHQVQ